MFNKKEKGGTDSLLYALMTIFATVLLMIVLLPPINCLYTKGDIEAIKRKYILEMEIDGCLTLEKEIAFTEAIEKISGVEDVRIDETVTQLARLGKISKYSETVNLQFQVVYEDYFYTIKELFKVVAKKEGLVIPFYAESTSKI